MVVLHATPQPLQFNALVLVLVSQPLAALLSQLQKPATQLIPQTPRVQVAVPLVVSQALPQALQCAGVASRSTSQPLATLLSQLPKPTLQAIEHWLFEQVAVP